MFRLARVFIFGVAGIACSKAALQPPPGHDPADIQLPPSAHLPDGGVTHPPLQRAANLTINCHGITNHTCEGPNYTLTALGDRVASCGVQGLGAATSIRLELRSSNDASWIIVAFDGYHGTGDYLLGTPGMRYVSVDDATDVPDCAGNPKHINPRVSAADPNCGSPACTVKVTDSASPSVPLPDATVDVVPFPADGRAVTFDVTCPSLCENNGDMICPGPFHFVTRATCLP